MEEQVSEHKTSHKIAGVVIAIILVLLGLAGGGIIGALIGAALSGLVLKKFGVVGENSALVSETAGVKKFKYVLLFLAIAGLIGLFYYSGGI